MTFEAWLVGRDYRSSTIRTSLTDARCVQRCARERSAPHKRLRPVAKRLLAWSEEGGVLAEATYDLCVALVAPKPKARALGGHAAKTRKNVAKSWADAEWRTLVARFRDDCTASGAVLQVLAATALRIGDVLRIRAADLRVGLRRDRILLEVKGGKERVLDPEGAPEEWRALYRVCMEAEAPTVADAVAPGGNGDPEASGAAYRRVARRLARHAKLAGVDGRAHLHRLRRTVAVQALRLTGGDIEAVRRLLGHESQQTTLKYLDEAMPERDAELGRALRARFAPDAS